VNTWALIACFFQKIPAAFWGVLAGSFFSLGGVVLSNRNSARNLSAQLENDRNMRKADREMALRKEIYLAASEAISVGLSTVGRFIDLNVDAQELLAAYIEKAPAIAKVNMIANENTLRKIAGIASALSATFTQLHGERLPGLAIRNRLRLASGNTDVFLALHKRSADILHEENRKVQPDPAVLAAMRRTLDFDSELVSNSLAEQRPLEQEFLAAGAELADKVVAHLVRLNGLLANTVASARDELAMPIDVEVLRGILAEVTAQQSAALQALIDQMRAVHAQQAQAGQSMPPKPPPGGELVRLDHDPV
jgi:hypothetical protein